MQSTKNKLALFNTLRCEAMATIDLQLLEEKCPQNADLPRFKFSPQRNADDILFSLLDYATEEEILARRAADENTPNPDGTPIDGDAGEGANNGTPNSDGTPAAGEGGEVQDGGTPNPDGTPAADEGGERQEDSTPNPDETPSEEAGQTQGVDDSNSNGTPTEGEEPQTPEAGNQEGSQGQEEPAGDVAPASQKKPAKKK